jgi:HAMP domain-containing protein
VTLTDWASCSVFLAAPAALLLTWLALGVVHVAAWVRRELDERERVRRELEQEAFDGEARAAQRRRYPAAGGGWWR